ncbi:cell division ABC transporter component permease FtsX [Psychromonas sp. CNPT3]|uniref:permease-like cell division protein FtsX n=1 Tax=Psychromonas sp. CNPT3 TaxID=314282 RepID=UPI00006E8AC4|nr:permease-like cell division protein FtsX [Psychromonas sp. CNPT3]AGH80503.1 cell division ABC transporter component permease FtsX [Psychromonas sp. CNPT3]
MVDHVKKNKRLVTSPRINKVSLLRRFSAWTHQHYDQIISSFLALWKTPLATFMTVLVLGIALSFPSVFHVFYKNIERVTAQWDRASEISLFLEKDISEKRIQVLINKLGMYDDIASITYISSYQALEEFKEMSGFSKALSYLDENPLPAVLVVIPNNESMDIVSSKLLVEKLKNEQEVNLVRLDLDWIEKVQAIVALLVDIVVTVALLLLISILLIMSNTIRLNILNQRTEIEVLQLVGATNNFIRRPFLYAGAWYGFLGGVIAWLLTSVLVFALEQGVLNLMRLYQVQFEIAFLNINETLLLLGVSTTLGLLTSYVSVKQYLYKISPR